APHPVRVDLFTGVGGAPDGAGRPDATGASGGLVRGFETDPAVARLATRSLAELLASPALRRWAGYRSVGSLYLLPAGSRPALPALAGMVAELERRIPDSAELLDAAGLRERYPFRDLPDGTVGVAERRAGYFSPAGLRAAVLARLPRARVTRWAV